MSISNLNETETKAKIISNAEANLNITLLFLGLLIVTFGLAYLFNNIGILELDLSWKQIWPMFVILIGFSFFPKRGWMTMAIGITIMVFVSGIIIMILFNGTKTRFNWEDVSQPYKIITQGQSKVTVESWIQKNSPTYVFDGFDLKFEKGEVIGECFYCYKFVYYFNSRHPGYGDRTGKLLIQKLTAHIIEVEIKRGNITSAVIDKNFNELNPERLPEGDEKGNNNDNALGDSLENK